MRPFPITLFFVFGVIISCKNTKNSPIPNLSKPILIELDSRKSILRTYFKNGNVRSITIRNELDKRLKPFIVVGYDLTGNPEFVIVDSQQISNKSSHAN